MNGIDMHGIDWLGLTCFGFFVVVPIVSSAFAYLNNRKRLEEGADIEHD